ASSSSAPESPSTWARSCGPESGASGTTGTPASRPPSTATTVCGVGVACTATAPAHAIRAATADAWRNRSSRVSCRPAIRRGPPVRLTSSVTSSSLHPPHPAQLAVCPLPSRSGARGGPHGDAGPPVADGAGLPAVVAVLDPDRVVEALGDQVAGEHRGGRAARQHLSLAEQ